jgi:hypothetical protein
LLMITHIKYPTHLSYSHIYNGFRIMGYLLIGIFVIFPNLWLCLSIFLIFLCYSIIGPYFMSKQ